MPHKQTFTHSDRMSAIMFYLFFFFTVKQKSKVQNDGLFLAMVAGYCGYFCCCLWIFCNRVRQLLFYSQTGCAYLQVKMTVANFQLYSTINNNVNCLALKQIKFLLCNVQIKTAQEIQTAKWSLNNFLMYKYTPPPISTTHHYCKYYFSIHLKHTFKKI